MMHFLVEDIEALASHLRNQKIADKYAVKISEVVKQDCGMLDMAMIDHCGVLWRIGQNL